MPLLAALLLGCLPQASAAGVLEAWRGVPAVVESALAFEEPAGSQPRTVLLCLDASASLAGTGIAEAIESVLAARSADLGRLKVGVHRVGAREALLAPTDDRAAIAAAVRAALQQPDDAVQDLCLDLRTLAQSLGSRAGERAILLVSLENGDAENDLEGTLARLKGTKTRLHALTDESYLSDSYWAERSYTEPPKDCEWHGGDSAVIDVPYGWLFQLSNPNEATPSGFGSWAISRLVANSGGRLFLYQASSPAGHQCIAIGTCLFCNNDHIAGTEFHRKPLLEPLAPSLASRKEVLEAIGGDPWAKATATAWRAALGVGLVRGAPPREGHWSGIDNNASGKAQLLTGGRPERNADRALAALKECRKILANLERDLARIDPAAGSPRQRAIAELTACSLHVTEVNLLLYAAWCEEIAPRWFESAVAPFAPEVPLIQGDPKRATIGYTNRSLCHGARPFLDVELPGGEPVRDALRALDARMRSFEQRYAHTPYLVALHRHGLAFFYQSFETRLVERPRPRSRTGEEAGPSSGTPRPARPGRASSTGTGPISGGGG
jgi:hypothetical protein